MSSLSHHSSKKQSQIILEEDDLASQLEEATTKLSHTTIAYNNLKQKYRELLESSSVSQVNSRALEPGEDAEFEIQQWDNTWSRLISMIAQVLPIPEMSTETGDDRRRILISLVSELCEKRKSKREKKYLAIKHQCYELLEIIERNRQLLDKHFHDLRMEENADLLKKIDEMESLLHQEIVSEQDEIDKLPSISPGLPSRATPQRNLSESKPRTVRLSEELESENSSQFPCYFNNYLANKAKTDCRKLREKPNQQRSFYSDINTHNYNTPKQTLKRNYSEEEDLPTAKSRTVSRRSQLIEEEDYPSVHQSHHEEESFKSSIQQSRKTPSKKYCSYEEESNDEPIQKSSSASNCRSQRSSQKQLSPKQVSKGQYEEEEIGSLKHSSVGKQKSISSPKEQRRNSYEELHEEDEEESLADSEEEIPSRIIPKSKSIRKQYGEHLRQLIDVAKQLRNDYDAMGSSDGLSFSSLDF